MSVMDTQSVRRALFPWILGLVVVMAVPTGVRPAAADGLLADAYAAYDAGDYRGAFALFAAAGDAGDAQAQFEAATMLLLGEGVPADPEAAVDRFEQAAVLGHEGAVMQLASAYWTPGLSIANEAQAYFWVHVAWLMGHPNAGRSREAMAGFLDDAARLAIEAEAADWYVAHRHAFLSDDRRVDIAAALEAWERRWQANGDDYESLRDAVAARYRDLAGAAPPRTAAAAVTLAEQALDDARSTELVSAVQYGLTALGYEPGPVNGRLGAKTRFAIEQYQQHRGLAVTGDVTTALVTSLAGALENGDDNLPPGEGAANVAAARPPAPQAPPPIGSGSGFVVSHHGHILTNSHVIADCDDIMVRYGAVFVGATLIGRDDHRDLALLAAEFVPRAVARFPQTDRVRLGETVVAIGFPLPGVLSSSPKVTTGVVSSMAGPGDDESLVQISAPIQAGNSGGPVFDNHGLVAGVVVSKLDSLAMAARTGDMPQNVNFAIKGSHAKAMLDRHGVEAVVTTAESPRSIADVSAEAADAVVQIYCATP